MTSCSPVPSQHSTASVDSRFQGRCTDLVNPAHDAHREGPAQREKGREGRRYAIALEDGKVLTGGRKPRVQVQGALPQVPGLVAATQPAGGTGAEQEPHGLRDAGRRGAPVGLVAALEGVPGALVLPDREQGAELGLGILGAPGLGLGQREREPPGAGLITAIEPQLQGQTEGAEVARVLLPGVEGGGECLFAAPRMEEGERPGVTGGGGGDAVQFTHGRGEVVRSHVDLPDFNAFQVLAGCLRAVGLLHQAVQRRGVGGDRFCDGAQVGQAFGGPDDQQGVSALAGELDQCLLGRVAVGPTVRPLIGGQGRRPCAPGLIEGIHQHPVGGVVIGEALHQGAGTRAGPREITGLEQALDGLELGRLGLAVLGRVGLGRFLRHRGSSGLALSGASCIDTLSP